MRRLDERRMLEARLCDHVGASELDRLADVLIQFYRHAPRTSLSPEGHLRRWRQALVNDRRILLEPRLGLPAGRVRWIDTELRRFLRTGRKQLDRRVHLGRILDLHGDLRPEHIWLADGVRIIDCLEFSAPLRAGDPLDEIAFLDLECERAGAPGAGRRIRERVARGLGESPNTPLYSFYRCHRAMLRARLCIAHLLEPNPRTPERWPRLARHYLDLACRDALALRRQG
jgi:aminoglycoside phosphotransferase family enzyme